MEQQHPEKAFLLIESTELATWSYADAYAYAVQSALRLQNIGVEQDERVLVWLPNGAESVRMFLGHQLHRSRLRSAQYGLPGQLLAHAIGLSKAKVAIVDATLLPFLSDVRLGTLKKLVVVGDAAEFTRLPVLRYSDVLLTEFGTLRAAPRRIEPWDNQSIMYTSGTTGPSKGVLSSYLHLYSNAGPETWTCIDADDRFFIPSRCFISVAPRSCSPCWPAAVRPC